MAFKFRARVLENRVGDMVCLCATTVSVSWGSGESIGCVNDVVDYELLSFDSLSYFSGFFTCGLSTGE
jgi:hypothetical protein